MSRYILLTKTNWDEPPRLRHQFATLLASAGNEVVFFEKPSMIGASSPPPQARGDRIVSMPHHHLLHHKLRMAPVLHHVNALVTVPSIRRQLQKYPVTDDDTVISFNYDYWFLRRLFPRNKIITVINDDFICVALFGYTKPLLWALERTCKASDRVLTVSVPLQKQLAPFSDPELFLPWADRPYLAPARSTQRDTLLFWGYINPRFDFDGIRAFADELHRTRPNIRILFVGPPDDRAKADIATLRARPNVEFLPSHTLDALPLDRVLAAYIPYRANDLEIDAITLSNKALQLLARGLPILISSLPAMPNFIEAPFVQRVDLTAVDRQIDELQANFEAMQPAIAEFVDENGADARLRQLRGA